MIRLVLVFLFLLLPSLCIADETEEQLKSFLRSREVINQVYFSSESAQISVQSKEKLDALAPKLAEIDETGYLIRVEGFASPDGDLPQNTNLSMKRALAVRTYIKETHGLTLDLFLTGFGGTAQSQTGEEGRRVDIAVYLQPAAALALFNDHGLVDKIVVK